MLLGVQRISAPAVHGPGLGIIIIALVGVTFCVSPLAILPGCLIPGRSDLPTVPQYQVEPGHGARVVGAVVLFLIGPVLGWVLGAFFQAFLAGMLAPPVFASLLALSAIKRTDREPDGSTES